jgi:YD repeat-containing protein
VQRDGHAVSAEAIRVSRAKEGSFVGGTWPFTPSGEAGQDRTSVMDVQRVRLPAGRHHTAYTYDLGGRLTSITPAGGATSSFSFDALGRHRTRAGTGTDTYAHLGTTNTAYEIAVSGGSTTDSLIDAQGSRLATKTGSAIGWALSDLHGNLVGDESASKTILDAFRYDAYGENT